jgi:hypothetical protein
MGSAWVAADVVCKRMKGAAHQENHLAPTFTYIITDVSRNGAQIAGKDKQHPKSRCWDREEKRWPRKIGQWYKWIPGLI